MELRRTFLLLLVTAFCSVSSVPTAEFQTKDSVGIKLLSRTKRQLPEEPLDPNCNFGNNLEIDLCQWMDRTRTTERWMSSLGENAGWLGGPPQDQTNKNDKGGYSVYETSKLVDSHTSQLLAFDSAMMMSPIIEKTRSTGNCIDFWYALEGLSQDRLRILLRPPTFNMEKLFNTNITKEDLRNLFMDNDGRDDIVLWENRDTTYGIWTNGQVVYSFISKHMIILEGKPLGIGDPNRAYVGYIALDDINFLQGTECKPFCNFEGGFCSWTQDTDDDFDWTLSRGSKNPSSGPPMDRFSFNYGIKGGGYAYIDAGYPRRPFDKARIKSEAFSPPGPDTPLCLRFWTHMYGNGIGALRIIISPTQGEDEIIWELKGEQANNWYQGQVTITASSDFQIIFEGEVGLNGLGDIAIDEIALKENSCPTSPQTASKFKGDCTFEVDECGWRNVEFRQGVDELDWERSMASTARPNMDHTLKSSLGSFMTLPRNSLGHRGERGWLMSPPIEPMEDTTLCLSFWYFMYDPFIEQTGPSLGSLKAIVMEQDQQGFQTLTPMWELRNNQGPAWQYGQTSIKMDKTLSVIFEGLWGNLRGSEYIAIDDITFFLGECTTLPTKAETHPLNCDFTRSSCSYVNATAPSSADRWITSTISRRPSSLADHTYGGPMGYVYFDLFNRNTEPPKLSLISKVITADRNREPICLTFWYAAVGNDPDSYLSVNRGNVDLENAASGPGSNLEQLWRIAARVVYKDRIEWMFGQVQINSNTDYKISFMGEAQKGGFAIDDILVYPGLCDRKPLESDPALQKNQIN